MKTEDIIKDIGRYEMKSELLSFLIKLKEEKMMLNDSAGLLTIKQIVIFLKESEQDKRLEM